GRAGSTRSGQPTERGRPGRRHPRRRARVIRPVPAVSYDPTVVRRWGDRGPWTAPRRRAISDVPGAPTRELAAGLPSRAALLRLGLVVAIIVLAWAGAFWVRFDGSPWGE